ncbi:alpha/beta hydrolase [Brevundimonas sp.]|uniref:alpha/beta hydrolase family protein n=1 Tax=Brevundimonas sp. TaxID=1871086 RepID=UPI001ACCB22A|nr:alpha/beta hydrolase [Brevundimonas sp.]MBN9464376.1 alpha/beta fold hydrolase [Brevundimonas sp.]
MSIRPAVAALTGLFFLIAPVAPTAALEAASVAQAAIAPTRLSIPAPDGRAVLLDVWTAPDERGVVVFSHGFGGAPEAYGRLLTAWARQGFTVIAPLHVDSQKHPNRDATGQVAFLTRLEDLGVARAEAARTHPGKPLIVAGHSFGSLMSLIEGGAVTIAGPMGDPAVKGVIAFSSAGNIPNVVTPETYSTLAGPLLVITGDRDLVPGFADDWRDHRIPFDASPAGDKTLLIFAGADHQLPGTADGARFDEIVQATEDFLDAYALNDAAARARLQAFAADGVTVERR